MDFDETTNQEEEYKQQLSSRKFQLFQTTFQNGQFLGGNFYRFNESESADSESPESRRISEAPVMSPMARLSGRASLREAFS